jgi:pimeloyl-ACP methyl ester carboxylesterase
MRRFSGLLLLCIWVGLGAGSARGGDVVEGTVRAPDGVRIVYDVRGEGEPSLVFVHCWACDRAFWREQVKVFAKDHRVVTLDLGGHGESGTDRENWTMRGLAHDVKAVVEELKLRRVILIGHSMGGPVALEAAQRMPDRVVGIVAVDTLHDAEFEYPEGMAEQMAARFEADFEGSMKQMVPSMFTEGADAKLVEWVIERACKVHRAAAVALVADLPNFDMKACLSAIEAPLRAINAAPYRPGTLGTDVETNRKYADFDAVIMTGVGHYLHLQKPEEFNDKLREVIGELAAMEPDETSR